METFDILQQTPVSESAVGAEILLLDRDDATRAALEALLAEAGFIVTALGDDQRALTLVQEKFFTVAILDYDTPGRRRGLDMVGQVLKASPVTRVVMLSERKTFDRAVAAFQANAKGIYPKGEDALPELFEAVVVQVERDVSLEKRGALIQELLDFLESFLRHLMQAGRRALRAEERAGIRQPEAGDEQCVLVVVDNNAKTGPGLQKALGEAAFEVVSCLTGGEALDVVSQRPFHLALIKQDLPDLEGSMVARSVLDMKTGATVLTFSDSGDTPGTVTLMEKGRSTPLIEKLERGAQLVEKLKELRQEILARRKERRYLDAFRDDYIDLLKQYVLLRRKLTALRPEDSP